jgi:hypothetical protein
LVPFFEPQGGQHSKKSFNILEIRNELFDSSRTNIRKHFKMATKNRAKLFIPALGAETGTGNEADDPNGPRLQPISKIFDEMLVSDLISD